MTKDSELHKNMVRCIRKAIRKAIRMTSASTTFTFEEVADAMSESLVSLISKNQIILEGETMVSNINEE
jgi:hypothetical protein